jgi:hypothetical protein
MVQSKRRRRPARGPRERQAHTAWYKLRRRCDGKEKAAYRNYAGRGITYDARWMSFEQFLADMGLPEEGMSLDRIDNDGNYCKDNCRWATPKEQNRNTRFNRIIEFKGVRKSLSAWAEHLGVKVPTLRGRLDSGWPLERALSPGKFDRSGKFTPNSDIKKELAYGRQHEDDAAEA